VSDLEQYARSFGAAAELYEAARPPYVDAAVAWVVERLPSGRFLDLAAGTGKLTRQLRDHGVDDVVAVEPDPAMRRTFERVLPGLQLLDGSAEAIPLPDGSVDAVTVGQAFHWFDRERALAELHRVTRPGGGFALLWNKRLYDDPALAPLEELLEGRRPVIGELDYVPGLFGPLEERSFDEQRRFTADELVAWTSSTSAYLTAKPAEQQEMRDRIRAFVGPEVELCVSTIVLVADRV
jgi:SAM-dependent methyltransferase